MPVKTSIRLRRGTASSWTSTNPVLSAGEPGVESDTGNIKVGDGTTAWSSLSYALSSRYAPVNGAWSSWTPTITAGSGTITTATASSCSYLKNGSLFVAEGFITITTAGTGSGLLIITLPAGVTWTGYTGGTYCGGFYEGNSGTFGSSVTVGTGEVAFANNNGTTIISSGATVRFQIFGQVS